MMRPPPTLSRNVNPARARIAAILGTAALLFLLAACAATPKARYTQARSALTSAQEVTLAAHDAGELTDQQMLAIDPYFTAAQRALAVAFTMLPAGGPTFDQMLAIAADQLTLIVRAETGQPPPVQ